jgi:hypothetical protein
MNRRAFLAAATSLPAIAGSRLRPGRASEAAPVFTYPIGWPGELPGDGFQIRHGYATENTWYNPGYWHTGEDCTSDRLPGPDYERRRHSYCMTETQL